MNELKKSYDCIVKLPSWEINFYKFLNEAKSKHFIPGKFDCCEFTSRCIEIMTGLNIKREFLSYLGLNPSFFYEQKNIDDFLKANGGLVHIVSNIFEGLGIYRIPIKQASLGDIMAGQKPLILGVSIGRNAAFVAKRGLEFLRNEFCQIAWRIT